MTRRSFVQWMTAGAAALAAGSAVDRATGGLSRRRLGAGGGDITAK